MIIDLNNDDMSIQEALFIANPHDEIILASKKYHEKVVVEKPFITIRGTNDSVIEYDDYATRIVNGKKCGTTGSATFTVKSSAKGFRAFDVTFMNSHEKKFLDQGEQAVAFKSETSSVYMKACKFISYQDTLYMDSGINNLIEDSYIVGDIDFIFGSADCVFNNCEIASRSNFQRGYYTAPSTLIINNYGLVFYKCNFKQISTMKTILGRKWYPAGATSLLYVRESIVDSTFEGDIELDLIKMNEKSLDIGELSITNSVLNGQVVNNNPKDLSSYINSVIARYNI